MSTPGMMRAPSRAQLKQAQSFAQYAEALKALNLDDRHNWIFQQVAAGLGIELSEVESYVIQADHITKVNSFLAKDGSLKLLWFYQPLEQLAEDEGEEPRRRAPSQLKISDGYQDALRGQCVFFLRLTKDELKNMDAIRNNVVAGSLDGGQNMLRSLQETMFHVMGPALAAQQEWGNLKKEDAEVDTFLDTLEKFMSTLTEVLHSLSEGITLRMRRITIENKPAAIAAAAQDAELVRQCEVQLDEWMRQIEVVLNESDVVKAEGDDVGPNAELEHWKARMAKFNSIVDQLQTTQVKVVLGTLTAARSPRLETWKALDVRITDSANEAKDNVKYLYTLERFAEPLYKSDPVQMVEAIPGLINAIKMMHSIARYYNTSERMTALFVKITNQMIACCKKYIQKGGEMWDQDRKPLIDKLQACLTLKTAYQEAFRATKNKLQRQPKDKQFDFSEMYIFGKFELFCKRVKKLIDTFVIVEQFSALENSTIEGMDEILARFQSILHEMQHKTYDLLDHKQLEFEADYVDFYEKIIDLERLLQEFINASFEPVTSTARALALLKQFKSVLLMDTLRAELENKYLLIFANYGRELDVVRKIYEKLGNSPPIPRDTPPVAGAIAWARQLMRRVEGPMKLFQDHPHILYTLEAKKVIRVYNKLAKALMQFETEYHQQWCSAVEQVKHGLNATLLIRHPDQADQVFVNFDTFITQVIRETKAMQRMGLETPETANILTMQEDTIKHHYEDLQHMLKEFARVKTLIPAKLTGLLGPYLTHIQAKIDPGLVTLTWTSLNIDTFIGDIHQALTKLEELLVKAKDIVEMRIDATLDMMSKMRLCELPEGTVMPDTFVEDVDEQCRKKAAFLDVKVLLLENAVKDLVAMITQGYTEPEIRQVEPQVRGLNQDYDAETNKALVSCVKTTLLGVAKRVMPDYGDDTSKKAPVAPKRRGPRPPGAVLLMTQAAVPKDEEPLFKAAAELQVPKIVVTPKMSVVSDAVTSTSDAVQRSVKLILKWGQKRAMPHEQKSEPQTHRSGGTHSARAEGDIEIVIDDDSEISRDSLETYFATVVGNPEVAKLHKDLSSMGARISVLVEADLATFRKYDFLWMKSKADDYEKFLSRGASIETYEPELKKYELLELEFAALPSKRIICAVSLDYAAIKESLIAEARLWKQFYGDNLKVKAHQEMMELNAFFEECTNKLGRNVTDLNDDALDDIRQIMDTLAKIRESETEIDMKITPVEETYSILNRFQIRYGKEEADSADNLRYAWKKVKTKLAPAKQAQLSALQPSFKKKLLSAIKQFDSFVDAFVTDYNKNGPMVPGIKPSVAVERLNAFQRYFEDRERKMITYQGGEKLFGLPVTQYPELVRIKKELKLLQSLYGLYLDVITTINGYAEIVWSELNLEAINNQIKGFQDKCKRLPKGMKDWEAFLELKKKIDDFSMLVPLLEALSNKAVLPRHWEEISDVTQHNFRVDAESFKLKDLLEAPLLKHQERVHDICLSAVREADIDLKLHAIEAEWADTSFEFAVFKKRGEIILNSEKTQEITLKLEESTMILAGLAASPYNKPFKAEIQLLMQKLQTCSKLIEDWLKVQFMYIYLEAVFVGGDISKAMPLESKRFASIDKSWLKIMMSVKDQSNVLSFVTNDDTLPNQLTYLQEQLEMCQNSLAGYLESKQQLFPRFYFLSNPALLEVLGSANSNCQAVQPHLKSVFAAINKVRFNKTEFNQIVGMLSAESPPEYVALIKPMECEGNVENWLNTLVERMRDTVKSIVRRGVAVMGTADLAEFCISNASQVALLGLQLQWTELCEKALMDTAKGDTVALKQRDLANQADVQKLVELTRTDLDKRDRIKVESLIIIAYHQQQVFADLYKQHTKSPEDFDWLKQTRFYWKAGEQSCAIRITDMEFIYCYEYLGCTDRLVITPLTDRCYITLAQAIGMSVGGAPAGPAGTGKTETVKDMGKALGKYCVVFNCSPEMTYTQLAKTFKGLAMSGCWGDFDEFNRIKLPVLSVAAQQISCIHAAKRDRVKQFLFTDATTIPLDKECGIFITMNPGYAGRQELPENLKLQFRTCAMMVPDRRMIMQVKLASAGFQHFETLAIKFFWLYKLCEEQLSKQIHYDFGLRNILSVLRTCGAVKRSFPGDSEEEILQRVCRNMNLSKLVDDDYSLFLSLLHDLFSKSELSAKPSLEMEAAIDHQCQEAGLVPHPPWKLKVIQLMETAAVRWGIMVLGPSGAGKTTCINTLLASFRELGESYREFRMNPKAIEEQQYLGKTDMATNEWKDGIFAALWRKSNATLEKKKDDHIWLTMDGPVDSIWIESLNTVLDDNKSLTLPSGDRLPMDPNLKLVFEVSSLDNASPATVSRAGMIYMSDSALGWQPVLESWFKTRSQREVEILRPLFEAVFQKLFNFVNDYCAPVMKTPLINKITGAMMLLNFLLKETLTNDHINHLFTFAVIWSLGGLLSKDDREKFSKELEGPDYSVLDLPNISADRIKDDGDTIFEYTIKDKGEWVHWKTKVTQYNYPSDRTPSFHSILVPTVEFVRAEFLIGCALKQNKNAMLTGESGTAKTVTILQYMAKQPEDKIISKVLNFSFATTPNLFQNTIEASVQKVHTGVYAPPLQKKMIVFVDDISMPEINDWGDQPTNEAVRQLIEQQGLYSLEVARPGEFQKIIDLQFLAAMFHPGGGRNDAPSRLKRHFFCINCTLPSSASIEHIFASIVTGHFVPERGFSQDVVNMSARLVNLTTHVWTLTKNKMLPTPEQFHYIFNLRDLARITEGLIDVQSDVVTNQKILLQLWRHECERVLADRLNKASDRQWFDTTVNTLVAENFGSATSAEIAEPVFFVDFMRDEPDVGEMDVDDNAPTVAPKIYEPVKSFKTLQARLHTFMQQYNVDVRGANIDLVLFEDCVRHIVKISRIIRRPRGNALLVGVGGSGKQSVTKLAAYIAGHVLFQIQMTRSYNTNKLMEDLQLLYKKAGADGKPVTFIFTDNDIKEEGFLEYINTILTSGEIANILPSDERDNILVELRGPMRAARPEWDENNMGNLYKYFIERVRANLHIVLCFSPVGEKFRARSLKFPGLISGCTIDWFDPWPTEALLAVSKKFLEHFDMVCTPDVKVSMGQFVCNVHRLVEKTTLDYFTKYRRRVHVTPKSYLSFINSFTAIYRQKKADLDAEAFRMKTGLEKLAAAEIAVAKLKERLDKEEVELLKAQEAARKQLAQIVLKTGEAKKEKDKVQKVKDAVEEVANIAEEAAKVAEEEVQKAMPAFEKAQAALKVINPKDINELRAGSNPVHFTQRVLDAVRMMRYLPMDPIVEDPKEPGRLKTSWALSVQMMQRKDFLSSLQEFPLGTLNGEIMELIEPYFEDEEFTKERAKSVNEALAGLFAWLSGMREYFVVSRFIEPKVLTKNKALRKLSHARAELQVAESQLAEKDAELQAIQAKYDEAQSKEKALQDAADKTKKQMAAATALIDGLAGEKERWTLKSLSFEETTLKLVGDCAVASAFLCYAGPFMQEFRTMLLNTWCRDLKTMRIPFSDDVNVIKLLADDNTIGKWNLEGLPTDEQSTQNGIITTNSARMDARFPLMIDPQQQGRTWILNREAVNNLRVVTLDTKHFKDILEQCVQNGTPLLIEDVKEELDPMLDNVFEKGIKLPNQRNLICKIGDKEVTYNPDFRLYLTTKFANPKYSPEICAKITLIDFTVTESGLEDQLLGRVIRAEQEYLETRRLALLEDLNNNKRLIKELEDNLLYKLSHSEGDLVEDEDLIKTLRATKTTAQDVAEKLRSSVENQRVITQAREQYRPVATRGSILYFLCTEMALISHMYQSSLTQFLTVFDAAIRDAPQTQLAAQRILNIIERLTYSLFLYVSRGLFEEHKFLFVLQMALKIDLKAGKVDFQEYRCFIKGGASLDSAGGKRKPDALDVSDDVWNNLRALRELPNFYQIIEQVCDHVQAWMGWYNSDAPEATPIPDGYDDFPPFRRMMLIRAWAMDRVFFAAQPYIKSSLGEQYTQPQPPGIQSAYEESNAFTPVVCLLSMGSDPADTIRAQCRKLHNTIPLECSMGEGQEVFARKLIQEAMPSGQWLLLQNCHLGIAFMGELVDIIDKARADVENAQHAEADKEGEKEDKVLVHPNFRLWLTTAPDDDFPISLLHRAIKVTNEPPQGMMAGLSKTFASITQKQLDHVDRIEWQPLLYTICFLHSVVQERRKFGPLGWNIKYEFNESDLTASLHFLRKYLYDMDPKKPVDWKTVRYMICEVQYGGRVTDDYDRRLLATYGLKWLAPAIHNSNVPFEFAPGYVVPNVKTVEGYVAYIKTLPETDSPEIFGLNPNADIKYRESQGKQVLNTILDIQPKDAAGLGGETRESVVDKKCADYLSTLAPDFIDSHVKARIDFLNAQQGSSKEPQPLNIFLAQEIQRMQVVITTMRTMLTNLKLAIAGTIVLSEQLYEALGAIYDGRVPKAWARVSWTSSSLGTWMKQVDDRVKQYTEWLDQQRPLRFDISCFFNPQGFLTAVLQEASRKINVQLDHVKSHTTVPRDSKEIKRMDTGVFLTGLILEGASWDRRGSKLDELRGKKQFADMPTMYFTGRPDEDEDKSLYQCPVYRTPRRTDLEFIFYVRLKTDHEEGVMHWIKRGVALLTTNS